MKFFNLSLAIVLLIIGGIENAPVIHPVHVQTIPLHPVTGRPTPAKSSMSVVTTVHSSQRPHVSSTTPSTTTHHHSSSWSSGYTRYSVFRIFVYVILSMVVMQVLGSFCKSKKPEKSNKNKNPFVVQNKLCVATIDGKREGLPPPYAEVHKV
jgi:hypothetical protein